ncbi:MAG: type II secretion system F family protein [Planctomycetota bacterium]|jgi:type IV pilus assembly protein PilC
MNSFKYTARDAAGNRKEGTMQAVSSNDVLGWLREQSLTPISVSEVNEEPVKGQQARTVIKGRRVKSADLSAVFWQLTTMIEGGIPVTTALEVISEDIENQKLRQIMGYIFEKMQKGDTFSDCLAEFPRVFNRLSCAMVLAGETGGNLPVSLRRLAEYFENRDKLIKKVQGAMAYPIFVLTFIILIVIFIMAFIIPRFRVIFDQMGGELPAFTQGFMNFYDMLRYNIVYIIGTVFLVITSGIVISRIKKGHYMLSKIVLRIPLFGRIISQAFVIMFCKTMATLIAEGVSVLEVFNILSSMTNNDVIRDAIIQARENVVEGSKISTGVASAGFFPGMVVKMIKVGEESGSLSEVLDRTAAYYERKVDTTITTAISMLEPIMIVSVGAIVTVVVLALYLPIFSMSK